MIRTAPWFIDHNLAPDGGGYDQQSERWTRVMGYYFQEKEYQRYLALPADEQKQYTARPKKASELPPDAEY